MMEAVFEILREAKSLELIIASYKLLTDLEEVLHDSEPVTWRKMQLGWEYADMMLLRVLMMSLLFCNLDVFGWFKCL